MTLPQASSAALDAPHPFRAVREFLNALNTAGSRPIEQLTPLEARQVLATAQLSVQSDYSGIEETQRTITLNGLTVDIHIVKPLAAKEKLPVFMFFHGGGWVLGDYPTHRRMVRDLVVQSGAAAVFPDYTPSPEARFPTAINQAYAATRWVAAHGEEIGVDGSRLAVAGNSVGGNMATAVSLMAKDKDGPKIRLQVLFWPVTDASFDTASYHEFAEGRFLTRNMMIWFWNNYTTRPVERGQIYASPLLATNAQLKGLPPALILTADNDVLRDEGEAYARKLEDAGVPVVAIRYMGMIHDWGLLNALAKIPAVQASLRQAAAELKNALQ